MGFNSAFKGLIIKPAVITKCVALYTAASTKHVQRCGHKKKVGVIHVLANDQLDAKILMHLLQFSISVFLNRRAAARYRALASIIPDCERFSWKLSF
jgi:hypothetical protein